jgi:hypothetical protein
MMMRDVQLSIGDICGDPTGLRVRVADVDIYDYAHFSVMENGDQEQEEEDEGRVGRDVPCGFRSSLHEAGQYVCQQNGHLANNPE